jgi:hypothetical protein
MINAAETWVDITDHPMTGKRVNFIVENGVLEFFIFSSTRPLEQTKKLAIITGFP